jgi:uncharacterized protein YndB with AHSA1/START domain
MERRINSLVMSWWPHSEERAVPRFYFDVREGGSSTRDTDGLEFNSLNAAEYEAARAAAEIGRRDAAPGG